MSIITVRKFVIVLFTIVILMVINALLHQSVFTPSYFGNSLPQGRVSLTDTDFVYSPNEPLPDSSPRNTVPKALQNKEDSENFLYNSETESQISASFSVSAPQNSPESNPDLLQEISKKNQKNFQPDFIPDDLRDLKKASQSDIVKNAPWPFSAAGGKEGNEENISESGIQSPLPPGNSRTVVLVERRRTSGKNETKLEKTPDDSERSTSSEPHREVIQPAAAVLPPHYHLAPRITNKPIQAPVPVPTSNELPQTPFSEVPSQTITIPEFPPLKEEKLQDFPPVEEEKLRDFPPVEEEKLRDFPPVEEANSPGLLKTPALEPKNEKEVSPDTKLQMPVIKDETRGNFPLAYGEMELVKPYPHFGVQEPVSIPSVPDKNENPNALLTIDSVEDLPESKKIREFPNTKE